MDEYSGHKMSFNNSIGASPGTRPVLLRPLSRRRPPTASNSVDREQQLIGTLQTSEMAYRRRVWYNRLVSCPVGLQEAEEG